MIRSLRLGLATRAVVAALVALALATPASAQFGGLKKKLKPAARQDEASKGAAAPGAQGGMIALTEEVVNRLIAGLIAGETARKAAAGEDTPYGRHKKAEVAYAQALISWACCGCFNDAAWVLHRHRRILVRWPSASCRLCVALRCHHFLDQGVGVTAVVAAKLVKEVPGRMLGSG